MDVLFISQNKDGNYYIGFGIPAKRNINPKADRKAQEVIILGVPKEKMTQFCADNDIKWEK